jgi:hypothetical protein
MGKKIYEIARELNISNPEILEFLESKSINVQNHMALVNNDIYNSIVLEFSQKKSNSHNIISFLSGATPDSEEEVADLFNEFKTLAENIITDPIVWKNDSYIEDDDVSIRISGVLMSENDKFRLTLDNDGSPCLDIYGIISPSTKLTASFSLNDERYKVEDQLNNVFKDIQNKQTGVCHKYYRPGDFG